jgi:hypothetical protein
MRVCVFIIPLNCVVKEEFRKVFTKRNIQLLLDLVDLKNKSITEWQSLIDELIFFVKNIQNDIPIKVGTLEGLNLDFFVSFIIAATHLILNKYSILFYLVKELLMNFLFLTWFLIYMIW